MKPYTYYISWTKLGKHYYGAKYGVDANPETFWVDYFTSSKYVEEMRDQYGDPDVIEVRKTFNEPEEAVLWEQKVLTRLKVRESSKWLNKSIGCYVIHDDVTKAKISATHKGKSKSIEHREKLSKARQGKKRSAADCKAISDGKKGTIFTEEHKSKLSKASKGKPKSEAHKAAKSAAMKAYWAKKRAEKLEVTVL